MKNIPDDTMISLNVRRKKKDDECMEGERKKGEKKRKPHPMQCTVSVTQQKGRKINAHDQMELYKVERVGRGS